MSRGGRDKAGKFVPGNQLWMLVEAPGPPKKYETPEMLWEKCSGYFKWVYDNPLMAAETVKFQGKSELTSVPKMRAMTVTGLCVYLGITPETWYNWKKTRPDLSETQTIAESVIYVQKVEGAASDLLNASFIGKEIGLVDKSEFAGPDGGAIQIEDKNGKDPMELARIFVFALNKAQHEAAEAKKEQGGAGALPST